MEELIDTPISVHEECYPISNISSEDSDNDVELIAFRSKNDKIEVVTLSDSEQDDDNRDEAEISPINHVQKTAKSFESITEHWNRNERVFPSNSFEVSDVYNTLDIPPPTNYSQIGINTFMPDEYRPPMPTTDVPLFDSLWCPTLPDITSGITVPATSNPPTDFYDFKNPIFSSPTRATLNSNSVYNNTDAAFANSSQLVTVPLENRCPVSPLTMFSPSSWRSSVLRDEPRMQTSDQSASSFFNGKTDCWNPSEHITNNMHDWLSGINSCDSLWEDDRKLVRDEDNAKQRFGASTSRAENQIITDVNRHQRRLSPETSKSFSKIANKYFCNQEPVGSNSRNAVELIYNKGDGHPHRRRQSPGTSKSFTNIANKHFCNQEPVGLNSRNAVELIYPNASRKTLSSATYHSPTRLPSTSYVKQSLKQVIPSHYHYPTMHDIQDENNQFLTESQISPSKIIQKIKIKDTKPSYALDRSNSMQANASGSSAEMFSKSGSKAMNFTVAAITRDENQKLESRKERKFDNFSEFSNKDAFISNWNPIYCDLMQEPMHTKKPHTCHIPQEIGDPTYDQTVNNEQPTAHCSGSIANPGQIFNEALDISESNFDQMATTSSAVIGGPPTAFKRIRQKVEAPKPHKEVIMIGEGSATFLDRLKLNIENISSTATITQERSEMLTNWLTNTSMQTERGNNKFESQGNEKISKNVVLLTTHNAPKLLERVPQVAATLSVPKQLHQPWNRHQTPTKREKTRNNPQPAGFSNNSVNVRSLIITEVTNSGLPNHEKYVTQLNLNHPQPLQIKHPVPPPFDIDAVYGMTQILYEERMAPKKEEEPRKKKKHHNHDSPAPKRPKLVVDVTKKLTELESLFELEQGSGAVPNNQPFNCPVCFLDIGHNEGVTLRECLHNLCRECLTNTVKHSEDAVVKCPCTEGLTPCEGFFQHREIRSVVPNELFEGHLKRSVQLAESRSENSFHCQTVDCSGWIEYEPEVTRFRCQVCRHMNCINCRAVHEGIDCRTHQRLLETQPEDKSTCAYLQAQLKSGKAMKCPRCQIIITKHDGCDLITCSMCQLAICWATKGPRWGPGGKGDTSGGCHCNENGKKCHPSCYNCH